MRYLLFVVLLFAASGLKAQQPNFTGTWQRNSDKCRADGLSINSIPVQLSIKQGNDQIAITRIARNYKGDTTKYTETLKADGSEDTTVIKSNVNKKAAVSWFADQKTLVETAAYADNNGGIFQRTKESWSLSADGKTLTIRSTVTINGQEHDLTEEFDKE